MYVKLVCGHVKQINTRTTNDIPWWLEVPCPLDGYQRIETVYPNEWHSRCRECRYSARHGALKRAADLAASRHTQRTGHATYTAYYGSVPSGADVVTDFRRAMPGQLALELPPPF